MTAKGKMAEAIREMDRQQLAEVARGLRTMPETLRRWAFDYPLETERALEDN